MSGVAAVDAAAGQGKPTRRIAALDGVRGIAITVGFVYHLPASPLPSGAMAVIDMFFVLSGFLIGSIVLRQAVRGRVDLPGFWAARVRRLFPALGLMLIIWGLVSWWVATPAQWAAWQPQIYWAAWYAENFYLISVDNNYFAEGRDSPFVHMWSLAVEEQFYLVFPLLVILAMALARKLGRFSVPQVVGAGALVLAVSSWTYAQVIFDPLHPAAAYYDPRAHAHGLLAGVFLACIYPSVTKVLDARPRADRAIQVVGMLALVVILVATVGADTSSAYHRVGAPLTVLGTLVLVVAAQRVGPASRFLSLRPIAFTGEVSYGIYIWGGGITVLLGKSLLEHSSLPTMVVWLICGGLTFVFATLSWAFVEMPIRRSKSSARHPVVTVGVGVSAMAAIGLFFLFLPERPREGADARTSIASLELGTCWSESADVQEQPLACALYLPDGKPEATVLLAGNSAMRSLYPAFARAGARNNWRVVSVNSTGCPLAAPSRAGGERSFDGMDRCSGVAKVSEQLTDSGEVDVVVALDMFGSGWFAVDASSESFAVESYKALLSAWSAEADVVLIQDYRTLDAPGSTRLRSDTADDRDSLIYLERSAVLDRTRSILEEAAAGNPRVAVVDINPLLCPDSWPCPEVVDDVRLRSDQIHFTDAGSSLVVKTVEPAILQFTRR